MIKVSIDLAKFKSIETEVQGSNGKPQKGIFIPYEANQLQKHSNGGVYANFIGWEVNSEYSTHMVKQSHSKEYRDSLTDEQKKSMPIFGNLDTRDTREGGGAAAPSGVVSDAVVVPDVSDDLPF